MTLLATGTPRPVMANLVAGCWLIGAILTLRWVFAHRRTSGRRWLATVAGVVGVTAAAPVLISADH